MKNAECAAQEILESGHYPVPIDVDSIASGMNLIIMRQPLEDTVSGMLVVNSEGGTIGVNEAHHRNRQRFSIAHEIGHYVLHRNLTNVFLDASPIFFRDESSSDGSKLREIEANHFAGALLMPKEILETSIRQEAGFDPSDDIALRRLANKFGVSMQALLIRLTRLNLIDG